VCTFTYSGTELDVFAHAFNWKDYVRSHLRPYVMGDVLEVGAGIGSNTKLYFDGSQTRWVCLEPDASLAQRIPRSGPLQKCEVLVGTLVDLPPDHHFDSIIYVDVLEHIDDHRREIALAADRLNPGGYLSVLSPAHQWLYTPFDEAVGHRRRYSRTELRLLTPASVTVEKLLFLDAAGLLASLANRVILKSASPTVKQIQVWDRLLVPMSRFVDPILAHSLGKSILAVWRKLGASSTQASTRTSGLQTA
jgi:SAM-dependent methyltransferase